MGVYFAACDSARYLAPQHFTGGGAREIRFRPGNPATDLLKVRQLPIGCIHRFPWFLRVIHNEGCQRLGSVTGRNLNHCAGFHPALAQQRRFQVFRVDVKARRGDNHILFTTAKAQIAALVKFSKVAGRQPVGFGLAQLPALPDQVGDGFAAHQHFAFVAQADFTPRQHLSY